MIFLDIKMEKLNGLKTAEEIRKIDSTVGIIFLTSLSQYVWKGYEYGAVNYLLKPIKYGRLKMELDRFFKIYKGKEEPYISFSNDSGKYKVLYKDIKHVETYNRNVMIHFESQEQVVYMNMKKMSELLEKEIDLMVVIDFKDIDFIEPLDISTIFRNAIDNAIERVEKLQKENRVILIKAGKVNNFISIVVENNYNENEKLGNRKTTKKDNFLHGYGISNIKNAVEKYNGTCTITKENEKFILKILIPIK